GLRRAARSHRGLLATLLLDVPLNHGARHHPRRATEIAPRPQAGHLAQVRELLPQNAGGIALEAKHDLVGGQRGRSGNEDMDVVRLDGDVQNLAPDAFCRLAQKGFQAWYDWPDKHLSSPCRYPHEVVVKQRNAGT